MSVEKRGKKWRVTYRHHDKVYREIFATEKEAKLRDTVVRAEKDAGIFEPPHYLINAEDNPAEYGKGITIRELMARVVTEYGPSEWKPNTLSQYRHRIDHYINPLIGDETVASITVPRLERFYRDLQRMPSVDNPGQTVGPSVIEKVHNLLNTSFRQAQRWGYLPRDVNTVVTYAKYPKYRCDEREIWTPEEYRTALEACEHHGLELWLNLSVACSARIGELLGLQWRDVEFLDDGTAAITIRQQLQRLDKDSMESSSKFEVYFVFPSTKKSRTLLVLCGIKSKDGVTAPPRRIFIGPALADKLKTEKRRQEMLREVYGSAYEDYDIVISQDLGRPYEEHDIRRHLKDLCVDNGLPIVVPHAMRHLSVTLKLLWSGDVKAVQADSGHKDAEMVFNRYSHALDEERQKLALTMDERLYKKASAG